MKKLLILLLLFISSTTADAKRLAVTEFTSVKANKQVLNLMTEMVRNEAANQLTASGIAVIDKQNMVSLLKDQGKGLNCIGGECEIEIGRNLGADYVITGNLILDEGDWILSLSLYNTASGAKIKGKTITKSSKKALRKVLPDQTRLLLSSLKNRSSKQRSGFKDGFESQDEEDDWSASGNSLVTVSFTSEPPGAVVLLDGELLCEATPCSQNITEGAHEVRITKKRYDAESRDLNAVNGASLHVSLRPKFGWFSVNTDPTGVEIQLDGQSIGKTPIRREAVNRGPHKLKVNDPCFKPVNYRFQTKANEHKNNIPTFELKARKSGVQVTAKRGSDAVSGMVYVDGKSLGSTGKTYTVPLCSSSVEVMLQGGKTKSKRLNLKEKNVSQVSVSFPALPRKRRQFSQKSKAQELPKSDPLVGVLGSSTTNQNGFKQRKRLSLSQASKSDISDAFREATHKKNMELTKAYEKLLKDPYIKGNQKAELQNRLAQKYLATGTYYSLQNRKIESKTMIKKSIRLFLSILEANPGYPRTDKVLFSLGSALQKMGQNKKAVKIFSRLTKEYTSSAYLPDAYVNIGEYYFNNNNAFKALKAYKQATKYKRSPKYGFAMYKLAWCYYNVQDYSVAIEKMQRAVTWSKKNDNKQLASEAFIDLVRFRKAGR